MTTSHKLSSSLTGKASVLTLLLMVAGFFAAPSAMAQQIPLTQEELDQQNRLQNEIANTTKNLENGQKQVNGVVYTPRWSNLVWVQPDSLSILFVYCLPGEFADSGQEILGGSELEVLESYSLAITNDLMVWFMVVENENENVRFPAAVGVICSSDVNDAETRVLSPQEQQDINNIIQQFITIQNTQVTNIDQVINIINNVTTNGTTGPVTPPPTNETGGITPPPPTNETGGITPPPTNETGGITPPPTNETGGITPPPPTNETGGITPPPPTNETGGITPPGNDTGGTQPPRGSDIGGGILDNATVAGEGRGGETSSQGGVTPPPTNDTGTTPPTIDTGGIGGPLFPD
jgi:hypothetical protein